MSESTAPGPAADLISYAAGIIVAKMREPHTAPYHWAGALWEAGMLVAPGTADAPLIDEGHVIEFRDTGWTIMHPLACRPNLFACEVNRAAERDLTDWEAPAVLGRFRCDAATGRFAIGGRLDDAPPALIDEGEGLLT